MRKHLTLLAVACLAFSHVYAADSRRLDAAASVAADKKCISCHDEMEAKPILSIYQTRHGVKSDPRTPTCQDCHGESILHGKDAKVQGKRPLTDIPFKATTGKTLDANAAQNQSAPCVKCHESDMARHWWGSRHESNGVACTSCHTLHVPRDSVLDRSTEAGICYRCHSTVRAETRRPSSHPIANGKLACRDCHAAHGGEGDKLLLHAATNDNCYTCHADKRGPFLWEHAPVSDDCLSCHAAHGSSHASLLKARQPWQCQQCHSSTRHVSMAYSGEQIPGGTATLAADIALRSCSNCHSRVHGSNHPSGARLLR